MKILDGGPPSTAIRTPDQRLRVFVSSTLKELAAERAAARAAIEQLRLAPVMFESGARVHPPQAVYRAYLGQSDIFIGIYWQRYGWVGPGMTISGLEDELRLAVEPCRGCCTSRSRHLTWSPAWSGCSTASGLRAPRPTRRSPMPGELGELIAGDLATILAERFSARARDGLPSGIPAPGYGDGRPRRRRRRGGQDADRG